MPRQRDVSKLTLSEAQLSAAIAEPQPACPELRLAQRLKARIEEHWRERGVDIVVELHAISVPAGGFGHFRRSYAITTNTVNGQPEGA